MQKTGLGNKIMTILLFAGMLLVAKQAADFRPAGSVNVWTAKKEAQAKENTNKYVVVLDAGHGGIDPGKVGIDQVQEKEINLAITEYLKAFLEAQGVKVCMTRTEDKGLYGEKDSNKKVMDMKNRMAFINHSEAFLAVSIHQNSYPESEVSGPQVFFYKNSIAAQKAALLIQDNLVATLKPEKERVPKANDSYYLLKKTQIPMVIVECGFLTNPVEAKRLICSDYQKRVAWAIHLGIMQIINSQKESFENYTEVK